MVLSTHSRTERILCIDSHFSSFVSHCKDIRQAEKAYREKTFVHKNNSQGIASIFIEKRKPPLNAGGNTLM